MIIRKLGGCKVCLDSLCQVSLPQQEQVLYIFVNVPASIIPASYPAAILDFKMATQKSFLAIYRDLNHTEI